MKLRLIAKIFKISSRNKKLIELLFENLKKQKIKINNEQYNSLKMNSKKNKDKNINISQSNKNNNINNISIFKNLNDISSCELKEKNPVGKKILKDNELKIKKQIENKSSNIPRLNNTINITDNNEIIESIKKNNVNIN